LFDRFVEVVELCVEEDKLFGIGFNARIGFQILFKRFPYAIINNHFVAFASFALMNLKAMSNLTLFIQELADTQCQQVRDAQSGVDSSDEKQ